MFGKRREMKKGANLTPSITQASFFKSIVLAVEFIFSAILSASSESPVLMYFSKFLRLV